MRQVLQTGLEVEMTDHLGYERHDPAGRGSGNNRNGGYPKTVTTEVGDVEVFMPRDREGTFEPVTIPKHQRRLDGLAGNVISLYAKGMTTGDIQAHLAEIYGTDISRETISKITDAIVEDMVAWQNRPLDRIYPVLLIDAIVIKVRDAQVANRPVYVAIGVNMDGERDVLGMWLGPTGGEGAKQWMTMLTELRNRGIADALIVCCDGLKGLPEAIRVTWPDATVQTCVVHLVRNSCVRVEEADWAPITKQSASGSMKRRRSRPPSVAFETFAEQWRRQVPGDDPLVGDHLGRVRAVPRVPARAPQGRLHHQRDRVAERQVPTGGPSPRTLPQRASRDEGPLPHRDHRQTEPREPHRPHQRLEAHPQRPYHPLRRPDRRPSSDEHHHARLHKRI
jgi:putative transposase